MSEIYFNKDAGKNAGAPKRPVRRNDEFEDISSRSENYIDDFEDISSYSSEEARYNDYRYEQDGGISMSKQSARNANVRKQNAKNASKAVYTNYDYPDER